VKIAYETTALQLDASGVARYVRGLRSGLRARADLEVHELEQPPGRLRGRLARGLTRELLWFPVGLARRARAAGADIVHCPGQGGPPRDPGLPLVVTIFDVMALEHSEWFTRANAAHARLVWPRILRHADTVIAAARFTRERLLDHFDWLDGEQVCVVPCGVDARFSPGPGAERERPYVLTVGQLQPRKNLQAAVAAFELVAGSHPEHELVVVGARGWRDDALLAHVRTSPVADRIVIAGRVTDKELVALYRGADCFLFPSRYEGFGFPPLEAMACATPVVCSNAASLPEVVGDAGLLVDPRNSEAAAAALDSVLGDRDRAEELRRRGLARAATFTWAACADATVAVYSATLRGAD
jgi:glycosyltransferase involved in cell wall biosynthesis